MPSTTPTPSECKMRSLLPSRSMKFAIAILIGLGIFFRFANLDLKFFWGDEVLTALRVSGYTEAKVVEQSYNGDILNLEDLQRYQFPSEGSSLSDTIAALSKTPEHPPLYFLLARFWMQVWMPIFGNSVAVLRSLSAIIGLAVFPCIYGLCLELFGSKTVAWIAMAIVAVSPLHVLYAQEARSYSLWTVTILLSSFLLLRSLRLQKTDEKESRIRQHWIGYTIATILGLYSHLLFLPVAIGQGIYVFAIERCRFTKVVSNYLKSAAIAIVAFSPWIWVIFYHFTHTQDALAEADTEPDIDHLIDRWFRNINRIFFGGDLAGYNFILVVFFAYALYVLIRHTPSRVWLYILTLVGFNFLVLAIPDLVFAARRTAGIRYLFPTYISVQLTFAYFFASQFPIVNKWQKFWQFFLFVILGGSLLVSTLDVQKEVTWNKSGEKAKYYFPTAQIINVYDRPLIISDASPVEVLMLSYRLQSPVDFQLVVPPNVPTLPPEVDRVFVLNPSVELQNAFLSPCYFPIQVIGIEDKERYNLQLIELLSPQGNACRFNER